HTLPPSSSVLASPPFSVVLCSSIMLPPPPRSTLFPYTTLFRSSSSTWSRRRYTWSRLSPPVDRWPRFETWLNPVPRRGAISDPRSEEHTSELQSRFDLVCRLLLEKKKLAGRAQTLPIM